MELSTWLREYGWHIIVGFLILGFVLFLVSPPSGSMLGVSVPESKEHEIDVVVVFGDERLAAFTLDCGEGEAVLQIARPDVNCEECGEALPVLSSECNYFPHTEILTEFDCLEFDYCYYTVNSQVPWDYTSRDYLNPFVCPVDFYKIAESFPAMTEFSCYGSSSFCVEPSLSVSVAEVKVVENELVRECVEWSGCDVWEEPSESAVRMIDFRYGLDDVDHVGCMSADGNFGFVSRNYAPFSYIVLGADRNYNMVHYVRAAKRVCVCWSDEACAEVLS